MLHELPLVVTKLDIGIGAKNVFMVQHCQRCRCCQLAHCCFRILFGSEIHALPWDAEGPPGLLWASTADFTV